MSEYVYKRARVFVWNRLKPIRKISVIEWFNMKKLVWLYLRNSFLLTIYSHFEKGCRKKNVHATIPKGNMGYDQYKVPDDCSCRTYFCCFPLALANTFACGLSYQYFQIYLKGLSRALFLTTFLEIAVYIYIFSQTVTSICYHIFILANKWSHKFGSY